MRQLTNQAPLPSGTCAYRCGADFENPDIHRIPGCMIGIFIFRGNGCACLKVLDTHTLLDCFYETYITSFYRQRRKSLKTGMEEYCGLLRRKQFFSLFFLVHNYFKIILKEATCSFRERFSICRELASSCRCCFFYLQGMNIFLQRMNMIFHIFILFLYRQSSLLLFLLLIFQRIKISLQFIVFLLERIL